MNLILLDRDRSTRDALFWTADRGPPTDPLGMTWTRASPAADGHEGAGPRRGQVLMLSNLHCFASVESWNGGHWRSSQPNRALLLNLLSDAIAQRTESDL